MRKRTRVQFGPSGSGMTTLFCLSVFGASGAIRSCSSAAECAVAARAALRGLSVVLGRGRGRDRLRRDRRVGRAAVEHAARPAEEPDKERARERPR